MTYERWVVYVCDDEWTGVSCRICHSEQEAIAFAKVLDDLCPLAEVEMRKLESWEYKETP